MKNFTRSILFLALLLTGNIVFAQKFEVPKEYAFKSTEDYGKYEEDVISAINWLNKTPMDQEEEKRKEVSKFLMDYMSGSPNVSIEINPKIVTFTENNPELLLIFMSGWTKYALQNPTEMDNVKGNMAGLRAVIAYYDKNGDLNKDKSIEKLAKLQDKGELRKWVKEQLKG